MKKAVIDEQNRHLIRQQELFRKAADVVVRAWKPFEEVQAIAVVGSVAGPLWKEVPRFREFRRARIEVWHECGDLDIALWLDSQDRLEDLRRAKDRCLREANESGEDVSTPGNLVDTFLFEPESGRYLGRLCRYNECPKGKADCEVPGCGRIPFNKKIPEFVPYADLLNQARTNLLYERTQGVLRSALELPPTPQS
ncbi:hypothetical protein [Fodinicurvata sediminis]|uniref:hypothetical protein n=1 Tax=Fodinicurvata sediminis TaxID=1121832 RepID=UPI0003B66409|nr:hypothetical protein [Fodinicurvata sediminis]